MAIPAIVPIVLFGGGLLALMARSADKEKTPAALPSPPSPPAPPVGGGAPPVTDAEKAAVQAAMGRGDPNELWQVARFEYALAQGTLDTSQRAIREQLAKDATTSANYARAKLGAKPLPYPPPPFGDPSYALPPGETKGPASPPEYKGPGAPPEVAPPPIQPPPGAPPLIPIPGMPGGGIPAPPGLPGIPGGLPNIPGVPGGQAPPVPAPPSPPPASPPGVNPPQPPPQIQPSPPQPPPQPPVAIPPSPPASGLPYFVKNGRPMYRVESGDYGARIAAKFKRPSSEVPLLVKANPQVGDWTKIQAGQELFVPDSWVSNQLPAVPPPVVYQPPPAPPPGAPPIAALPPGAPPIDPNAPLSNGKPLPKGGFRQGGQLKYTIQSGDYGGLIVSKWYRPQGDIKALIAANPGFNFSTGKAGDVLNIPATWG